MAIAEFRREMCRGFFIRWTRRVLNSEACVRVNPTCKSCGRTESLKVLLLLVEQESFFFFFFLLVLPISHSLSLSLSIFSTGSRASQRSKIFRSLLALAFAWPLRRIPENPRRARCSRFSGMNAISCSHVESGEYFPTCESVESANFCNYPGRSWIKAPSVVMLECPASSKMSEGEGDDGSVIVRGEQVR